MILLKYVILITGRAATIPLEHSCDPKALRKE